MAKKPWKCLSVRQPWAWAIIWGGKDVENRVWPSTYIGRLYIHASLKEEKDDVDGAVKKVAKARGISVAEARADYERHLENGGIGAIIGSVTMYGCAVSHESDWFLGDYGFLLRDAKPLKKPIKARGMQRIFNYTP